MRRGCEQTVISTNCTGSHTHSKLLWLKPITYVTEKGKTNYSRNGPTQPKTLASTCKHNKSHTKEGGFTLTVAKQQQLNHTNANTVICCHCFSKQTMAAVQWLLCNGYCGMATVHTCVWIRKAYKLQEGSFEKYNASRLGKKSV